MMIPDSDINILKISLVSTSSSIVSLYDLTKKGSFNSSTTPVENVTLSTGESATTYGLPAASNLTVVN